MEIVGALKFDDQSLEIYESLDKPLFRASDIARMIGYSDGNTWKMLEMCESDEKLNLPMVVAGQKRTISFVNETGLYNILSQSRKPIARKWRRVIHLELIRMRRAKNLDISEQFDKWNHLLDDIYFDEETGIVMRSVTVADGDVEQIPYEPGE